MVETVDHVLWTPHARMMAQTFISGPGLEEKNLEKLLMNDFFFL